MELQNRPVLDMITASQGGTCAMLGEECCFYVNKSREIQSNINQISEKARDLRERATNGWLLWEGTWSWLSWLSPLLVLLFVILLIFLIILCLVNCLSRFIS
jgi:hypothetical protein